MPHTPCTPNTSQVSSTRSHFFRVTTPHRPVTPPTRPIISAPPTPTVPQAGVIATRPAIAPELAPSREGLPRTSHSTNVHDKIAPAVAITVFRKARAAIGLAALAEPADIQDCSASEDHWQVVGFERFFAEARTFTQQVSTDQTRDSGVDMDNRTTGEVQRTVCRQETAGPNHVCHWNVGESQPDNGEDKYRRETYTFSDTANDQRHGDTGE